MIAIGGAIGTGLFLGAGARLQMAGARTGTGLFNLWLVFVFLFCVHWVSWCYTALPVAVFVSYAREFLGEKAAYVAGWMYFINWAMTGDC